MKRVLLFILMISALVWLSVTWQVPAYRQIMVGQQLRLGTSLAAPFWSYLPCGEETGVLDLAHPWPTARQPGQAVLQVRLLGILPVKEVTVDVLPRLQLVPGGQSIGVILPSQEVLVVGYAPVTTSSGEIVYPARDAGVLPGDVLLEVNGRAIKSDRQAMEIIDAEARQGDVLFLRLQRGQRRMEVKVRPAWCEETQRYRIGLYIRDSAAGVGTLTFYDPERRIYGALGHRIDQGAPGVQVEGGQIVQSSVEAIQQARRGQPGEKIGFFADDGSYWGTIEENTAFGIFGLLSGSLTPGYYNHPLPIAFVDEVKVGPAEILTVVTENRVDRFQIVIDEVLPHDEAGRELVIQVADPYLLSLTGGIVQGMSGSPIIQNGRLIGAVTHVFVNDPTRGYGVLIERMLAGADIWKESLSYVPSQVA